MKTVWHGCYDKPLKGFITDRAHAHPAKFSLALVERIYDHCLTQGYLRRGDTVGDPFGGVAIGGLVAAYRGLNWIGVELEPRFVEMAKENILKHASKIAALGHSLPTIAQGDSRTFDKIVEGIVTSPPFTQTPGGAQGININGYQGDGRSDANVGKRTYQGRGGERAEGNIETLPQGNLDAAISSPPYAVISSGAGGLNTKPPKHAGQQSGRSAKANSQDTDQRYGNAEGQIAKLKPGELEAVVTSPPWQKNSEGSRKGSKFKDKDSILKANRGHGASDAAVLRQAARAEEQKYGESAGQIGQLKAGDIDAVVSSPPYADRKTHPSLGHPELNPIGGDIAKRATTGSGKLSAAITSPPYADSVNSDRHGIDFTKAKKDYPGRMMHEKRLKQANKRHAEMRYGATDGQIGALHAKPLDATVTSPPYEGSMRGADTCQTDPEASDRKCGPNSQQAMRVGYGNAEGQIGRDTGETYWQAMLAVYKSCFQAIKPGGVACIVMKDFVKDKKRQPLCDDTARLLEHLGFVVIERIRAMLKQETVHNDLFQKEGVTVVKKKASFFRRLAESKGSPPIDWEEVIICRKPEG